MSSYQELYALRSNSDLQEKVAVAVVKKAQALIDAGSLTANAKEWCNEALQNPVSKGNVILNYVLAKNSASSVAQIQAASDATIQSNVSDAVDALIA